MDKNQNQKLRGKNTLPPQVIQSDQFYIIPYLGHQQPLKESRFHHPKKVTIAELTGSAIIQHPQPWGKFWRMVPSDLRRKILPKVPPEINGWKLKMLPWKRKQIYKPNNFGIPC